MNKIKLPWAEMIRKRYQEVMEYFDDAEKQQFIKDIFEPLLKYAEKKEEMINEKFNEKIRKWEILECSKCGKEVSVFSALITSEDDAYCKDCIKRGIGNDREMLE